MRLPDTFDGMRKVIEETLEGESCVIKGRYRGFGTTTSVISGYSIGEKKSEKKHSVERLELYLNYMEKEISPAGRYVSKLRVQGLVMMSPKGDPLWYRRLIVDIWEGVYPSCVAYDKDSGELYLVYLKESVIILKSFSQMTARELESVEGSLNEQEPYRICLDPEGMERVLAGVEGTRYLMDTMYIELDIGVKIKIPQRGV